MAKVLIVYGTTGGHTGEMAARIGEWVLARGFQAEVLDSATAPLSFSAAGFDASIVMGSIHETNHQRELIAFVKAHAADLQPSLFLSASLSAVNKDEKHRQQVRTCIDRFYEQTGWRATADAPVAGALLYTKYSIVVRAFMRMICEKEGAPTDTSRDYEFTDWVELERTVNAFLKQALTAPV